MNTSITVTGFVATVPKHTITSGNVAITSFRVGVSGRRFERATGTWTNTETSWLSVSCFRYLAVNAYASINKGVRVGVTDALGWPADWIEAACFAWLAWARLNQVPATSPCVTGASRASISGAVYLP